MSANTISTAVYIKKVLKIFFKKTSLEKKN